MNNKKIAVISALSGMLSALPYIFENIYFLIFFSISPALYCILKNRSFSFKSAFFYFFSFYFFADLWFLSVGTNFLSSVLIGFPLSFVILILIALILSLSAALPFVLFKNVKVTNPIITSLIIAFLFVFGEWLHGVSPINFPWNRLCNIVSNNTAFIQSSSFLGGMFISLTIVLINLCIANMAIYLNKSKIKSVISLISATFIFMSNIMLGYAADSLYSCKEENFSEVLVIQPDHSRKIKYTLTAEQMLEDNLRLSEENITSDTKLVVLAETALSNKFFFEDAYKEKLYKFVEKHNVNILFGVSTWSNNKKFNSCLLLSPDKKISEVYSKRQLVPFGEYTPSFLPKYFNFLKQSFDPSGENVIIDSGIGKIGCSICFESVFPLLNTDTTQKDAEFFAILTNDSWLGNNVPLYQHHTHSVLRAVENRKYTVTCANTGISSVISSSGKILAQSDTNTIQTISANICTNNIKTLYSKTSDIIVIPAFIIIVYLFIKKYFL